jgi:hypothetical protein
MKPTHEFTLWFVVMVLGLHFLEEFALDIRTWLQGVFQVPVTWEQCHLVNAAVTLMAIGGSVIGWRKPELSLIMPAIVIVNAFFFHLAFSIIWRSYSPGTLSALLLFVPAGLWCFIGAHRDGVLTRRAIYVSVAAAVFVHLWLLSFHLIGPP